MNIDAPPGPWLDPILERWKKDPTALLQVLREAQETIGWLPPNALTHVAAALGLPRARVEGVAGFYAFLHTRPVGRYRVLFSNNITDRMLGNQDLLNRMCTNLWIEQKKVSEDGLVSVDTTSCTGMCDQGPAILVNNIAITRMTAQRVDQVCELIRAQVPVASWPAEFFAVEDNIRKPGMILGSTLEPGTAIRSALQRGAQGTLAEVKASNTRGRGGAGFSTGQKWEACRNAPGAQHYVVCNADEGEPGTFKDRVLLSSYANLVFEGMTVAALVVGARRGLVYLRGEYRHLLDPLHKVLQQRRDTNLLGKNICGQVGFDFDIDIHLGAGAYVCGEESALIESLEGKRGVPRNRPPYPVTCGYLGQPTVVNNVETFCAAALVAHHGADWYRAQGTSRSAGSKIISVSGDCASPGLYEYPFGVTVAQVLADCGATNTQAVQVSGPSGVTLDESEFGRRLAFEDVPTAGAFMVFNRARDMFLVAKNFAHFFAHESCGFCTPCRVATTLIKNAMDKISSGHGSQHDLREIVQLNTVLQQASHCGLGHTACNPVFDTMKKFRPAYERRLTSLDFEPDFDLDGSLERARQVTHRDDAAAHLETEMP